MGWLWSSNSPSTTSTLSAPLESSNPPLPSQPTPEPPPQSTSPKPLSRDELAEQELNEILKEFHTDTLPQKPKYTRKATPTSNPNNGTTTYETDEPLGSQLLPTTMSCRAAFDEAFYCNSLGGRWNDLYRYGTVRDCSGHWNNFWFCMKTRSYSGPSKEAAIKEHYRQRESMNYSKELGKESSEDVWKSRERKLEWGEAFSQPFPPKFEGSDEEWRQMEEKARQAERNQSGTMGLIQIV